MKTVIHSGKTESKRFVIHKHDAQRLHYDLRIEVGGVLKCWAVPKGPSIDPAQKRLAVPTEDHAIEYLEFEGVIPRGEYGAGTVLVWDAGTYVNLTEKDGIAVPIDDGIRDGHVKFWLNGSKLRGGFALTRFRTGKNESWLLVKTQDDQADPHNDPVRNQPDSAISGRSLEKIREEKQD